MKFGAIFLGLFGVCLLLGSTGAAVTAWTEPVIASKDGSATVTTTKINENLADAGSTGITLVATGATSYELTPPTVNGVTFSAVGGVLTKVSGTIDFETNPTLIIVVEGRGTDTGTATVTLSVEDVNEAPEFMPVNYVTCVNDGSGQNTAVYQLNATDQDTAGTDGNIAGYTIKSGNTNTDFAVSGSGAITVASGKTITQATTNYYILVIEANDGASTSLTGTTTIGISICPSSAAGHLAVPTATTMLAILFALLN